MRGAYVAVLLAIACQAAHGQVYRCKDPDTGRTTYSQTPCANSPSVKMMDASQSNTQRQRRQTPGDDPRTTGTADVAPSTNSGNSRHTVEYKQCWASVTGIAWGQGVALVANADVEKKIDRCVRRLREGPRDTRQPVRDTRQPGRDTGLCFGYCASEQGMCIANCNGDGQCIGACGAAHGRCVSQCR